MIRSQITKFTKILCHENLELYGNRILSKKNALFVPDCLHYIVVACFITDRSKSIGMRGLECALALWKACIYMYCTDHKQLNIYSHVLPKSSRVRITYSRVRALCSQAEVLRVRTGQIDHCTRTRAPTRTCACALVHYLQILVHYSRVLH